MEELTKSQIVLLTLLVSFITSIATGIVTVSLMDQAPPAITQTVNRVVERTVERVVPKETQVATVITKEKTVVVKESEMITQAVSRISPSMVDVKHNAVVEEGEPSFVSKGFVIVPGYIVANFLPEEGVDYYIVNNGSEFAVTKSQIDDVNNIMIAKVDYKEDDSSISASAVNTSDVVLGQTVVAISGKSGTNIATGIITSIDTSETEEGDIVQKAFAVDISNDDLVSGSVLVNTDGAVIGMYTGSSASILPASVMINLVSSLENDKTTDNPI